MLLIETFGAVSSLVMVPLRVAVGSPALTGDDRVTLKVSLFSYSVSPITGTKNCFEASPASFVSTGGFVPTGPGFGYQIDTDYLRSVTVREETLT